MVAERYVESEKTISNPSDRSQWTERAQGLLSWATSFWVLAIGFVIVTLAAAGPLRVWDYKLNRRWLYLFEPTSSGSSSTSSIPSQARPSVFPSWRSPQSSWHANVGPGARSSSRSPSKRPSTSASARSRSSSLDRRPHCMTRGSSKAVSSRSAAAESAIRPGTRRRYSSTARSLHLIATYSDVSTRTALLWWGVAVSKLRGRVLHPRLALGHDLIGGLLIGGFFLRLLIIADKRIPDPRT